MLLQETPAAVVHAALLNAIRTLIFISTLEVLAEVFVRHT